LEQENQDLEKSLLEKNEENSRLKKFNQELLKQIRKLKEEKLENPYIKDIDKSDNEESTVQDAAKSTEKKTTFDVGVQTMEAPGIFTNRNASINKATSVREENHISKLNEENKYDKEKSCYKKSLSTFKSYEHLS
jgi:hypothetical protein